MSNEDFLDVDQPIPGQNFVCLSFVSPEKNILQKDKFMNLLTQEAKRYDIQSMHNDLNNKINNIVANIKKDEKHIIDDEER